MTDPDATENELIVRDLAKRYGDVEAVRGVSFDVGRGEIFGLLGPNGAGKTSALECVIGLRKPDAGSVRLAGIDAVAEPGRVKRHIGVALQSTALQDKITPREALRLFAAFYPKHLGAEALIERFALGEKADAPFDSLSGGQKQRLALALAFVNEPRMLFLDEPTSGLDPQSRRELHASIRSLRAEGRTVLLTTHYIEEAHALCDRIAIVDRGRVIATGKPDELIARAKALPRVAVRTAAPLDLNALRALPGVREAEAMPDNGGGGGGAEARVILKTPDVPRTVAELARLLGRENNELLDLQIHKPSLEDVFIELTGERMQ